MIQNVTSNLTQPPKIPRNITSVGMLSEAEQAPWRKAGAGRGQEASKEPLVRQGGETPILKTQPSAAVSPLPTIS